MPFQHFLLIYDVAAGHLLEARDIGTDGDAAIAAYAESEQRYADQASVEVVLLGSDSIETIKQTHPHYFSNEADREFFETVLA
jgi:hypothetical protein